jgi:hypothetical protein
VDEALRRELRELSAAARALLDEEAARGGAGIPAWSGVAESAHEGVPNSLLTQTFVPPQGPRSIAKRCLQVMISSPAQALSGASNSSGSGQLGSGASESAQKGPSAVSTHAPSQRIRRHELPEPNAQLGS